MGLFLLSEGQIARSAPFFPLAHGVPRVDDRRVVSGIVHVIKHGLQWKDAPEGYDSSRFREALIEKGIEPCIPSSISVFGFGVRLGRQVAEHLAHEVPPALLVIVALPRPEQLHRLTFPLDPRRAVLRTWTGIEGELRFQCSVAPSGRCTT